MSAPGLLAILSCLIAVPALGCGVPALDPVPVRIGEAADALGILLMPAGWAPGDPAAVLLSAEAFRQGCEAARAETLLEAGALVLALDPASGEAAAPLNAASMLRKGFGAGEVALMWPVASACRAPAAIAAAWPPPRICGVRRP